MILIIGDSRVRSYSMLIAIQIQIPCVNLDLIVLDEYLMVRWSYNIRYLLQKDEQEDYYTEHMGGSIEGAGKLSGVLCP